MEEEFINEHMLYFCLSENHWERLPTLSTVDSLCSMHMKLHVFLDLPYDLVLGCGWLFFCQQTLSHASFVLSSVAIAPGTLASKCLSSFILSPTWPLAILDSCP
jgi:hypothetical protein